MFIAEGVKTLYELLNSDFKIKKIYALKNWIEQNANIDDVTAVTEAELKRISNFETPNKVLAVVEKKTLAELPDLKNKITIVLDGIRDPGNLGTIIRTADWFGIENIVASNDTADVYSSKVIQATMGSFIRVNIFYIDLIEFLSGNTISVYGAVLKGDNISSIKSINECLLIIGNESKGIRAETLPFINHKVGINRLGNAESLNAAVAAGIILWKLKQQ